MGEKKKNSRVRTITQSQFARRFGITRQYVNYLVKNKTIKTINKRKIVQGIPVSEIENFKKLNEKIKTR